jgi:hypothetical protein
MRPCVKAEQRVTARKRVITRTNRKARQISGDKDGNINPYLH